MALTPTKAGAAGRWLGGAAALVFARFARAARDRRGVALIEMALLAPPLFFMLVFFVNFGRAVSQNIDLNQALRAGAQQAIAAPTDAAAVEGAIRSALSSNNLDARTVTVTCFCGALPSGSASRPAQAACTAACPAGNARMMTLRAETNFHSYTAMLDGVVPSALNINRVSGDVTIRFQ